MKTLAALTLVFAACSAPALAGPCTSDIQALQSKYDSQLDTAAATGPSGTETTDAKLHHQPTPGTVADADNKLGDVSTQKIVAFNDAMTRANTADVAGDAAACRAALAQAETALKR